MNHQSTPDRPEHRTAGTITALRAVRGAGALGGLSQSLAGAAGALLVREMTGRESTAGWPQAALVLGAAGAALVLTRLTRSHGRRVALAVGALAAGFGAVVVVGGAASSNFTVVLLGSVLLGAGNTTVMLGRYAAGELAPAGNRAREMGWVLAATAVGAVVGPGLLGPSGSAAQAFGLPDDVGPYVFAVAGYAMTAVVLLVGMREESLRHGSRVAQRRAVTARRRRRVALAPGAVRAIAVLGAANLVMVTAMTMAPVHLHQHGVHLNAIGMMIGVHVAGMFVPSPLAGWITDRLGAQPVVAAAGALLVIACVIVSLGVHSPVTLLVGLALLGVGWNAALVAGSEWLASGASAADRPILEGYGEVAMGVAAAAGAVSSGVVSGAFGYAWLAAACAVVATVVVPVGLYERRAQLIAAERVPQPAMPASLAEDCV